MRRPSPRVVATALVGALLALTSCGTDRLRLAYELEPGRPIEYHMSLTAVVVRTLSGEQREQRLRATFLSTQEVVERTTGATTARVRITLVPESLVVDGRAVTPGPARQFLVELGADGRVQRLEGTGESPDVLAPIGLEQLVTRLRPVLPSGPVTPGATWTATTTLQDAAGVYTLSMENQLTRLGLVDGRKAAHIRTAYEAPVGRTEVFDNAIAEFLGDDAGNQEAWFAVDGFLVSAVGDSLGRYEVTFRPPGGGVGAATVTGRLSVRVHTEIALVEG